MQPKTLPTKVLIKHLVHLFLLFLGIHGFSQTTDTFTTTGSWTVPAGVTSVTVEIWGAGGGGGGSNSNGIGGSGGGSGAYSTRTVTVSPGANIPFTIGTGGAAGVAAGGNGAAGGNSSITIGGSTLTANGGTGGQGNAGTSGTGGTASGGTTNIPGNNGTVGGASGGNGGNAPNGGTGGIGATNNDGNPGNTPGGGGGGGERGGGNRAGGSGARGEIRFTYTASGTYCTPTNTYSTSYYISGVTTSGGVANINNTGTGFSAYTDYSANFVSQYPGSSFSISATHPSSTYGYNVWIDWNNDGDFADAGENVISTGYLSTPASLGTVTIPGGQATGNYRMRIRNAYLSNPAPACGSHDYGEAEDYTVRVIAPPTCSGTPTAGTTTTNPISGSPGSNYTVSATGFTIASGLTYQWQYSTNGGSTWTNQGAATSSYSNYTATAPALGTTVLWHLIVTCTSSGQSATSSNGTFTSVNTLNVPTTGSNTLTCGTNITLYDNGGSAGNYANSSSGYTVLEAGLGATININGNYDTESGWDYVRIYDGTGIGGTLLASYSGTGTINYTGTAGQTLTVQFYSDSITNGVGFNLSVTYSGVCYPTCSGTPSGGTVSVNPNTTWPSAPYTVSATGYTQALNLTYQWQYSIDAGTTWINAGAATSSYANYTATAPASGDVHWQLVVTCTNSGLSSTSTIAVFVTMAVSDVETGCPGVISGGLGLNGADPAPIGCTASSTCVDLEATYLDLGDTSNYIVEPIAYNPPFAFNGLANPVSVNTDDVWSPVVNLPFDFCFYGNTYTQCTIGSNGILTFDISHANGSSGYSFSDNIPISGHSQLVENTIFGVFHDIDPGVGGEVGWELVTLPSGCRALVASWYNVPLFGDNTQFYTGMMVLYENSNVIEIYIQNKPNDPDSWNGNNAIVGIQNSTGTLATVAPGRNGLDADWTATNEAWRFVPNGTSITSLTWYEGSGTSGPIVGTTDVINVCPTSTTTYTAAITYTFCDGSTLTETEETTVTINGAKVWNGSVNNDWNNNNNWTPTGIPTAMDCVVIPNTANDPVISGSGYNGLGLNMSIQNDAVLTVNADNAVTITDWVNISATGELILDNAASLVQTNNVANTGTGNMLMDRDVNIRKLDYVYWSSPVTSFASSAISPGTPTSLIWKWSPTVSGNGTGNAGTWVNGNESMIVGKGYIVRGPGSYNSTLQNYTATFVGTPNNGDISLPITRGNYTSGATYQICSTCTPATNLDDNWNLVGNPYPSAIDAIDFLTANPDIDGYIKLWTHGTLPSSAIVDPFYEGYVYNYSIGDYITYNSSGSSSGPGVFNGYIGAGQGFFVSMLDGGSSTKNLNFTNALRSNTYNNGEFFRTANTEKHRIWLDIVSENNTSTRTLIGYIDNATNSKDRLFDAKTDNKLELNLYSLISNETFTIQGRKTPFDDNDIVPLGFKVPTSGIYSIGIASIDGLFENNNQAIFLQDLELGIIHDLRSMPYSFQTNQGENNNRFNLIYKNNLHENGNDLDSNNVWLSTINNLSVHSNNQNITSVKVYDILGRVLTTKTNLSTKSLALNEILKTNSGLIIEITLDNNNIIYKKMVY